MPNPKEKFSSTLKVIRRFDPKTDSWLQDHCPTYVIPTMPFTIMISIMMEAAHSLLPQLKVVGLQEIFVTKWVSFEMGAKEILVEGEILDNGTDSSVVKISLSQYRQARLKELSRFEPFCQGRIILGKSYRSSEVKPIFFEKRTAPRKTGKDFYGGEYIFSGPNLQLIDEIISIEPGKVISFIKSYLPNHKLRVPFLLDASTQTIVQIQLNERNKKTLPVSTGAAHGILSATLYSEFPTAKRVRCEVAYDGILENERFPKFVIRIFDGESMTANLWAEFQFVAILFPIGKLFERIPRGFRKDFFQNRKSIGIGGLSDINESEESFITVQDIKESDWLPGTVTSIYLGNESKRAYFCSPPSEDIWNWLALQVAAKDLLAWKLNIHPAKIQVDCDSSDQLTAHSPNYPLNCFKLNWMKVKKGFRIICDGKFHLDETSLAPLRQYWINHIGNKVNSPPERIIMGISEQFLKKHFEVEPERIKALRKKPCIYLANHQTYIESLIAILVLSAHSGCPVVALAKQEHQDMWLGFLTDLFCRYPGNDLPPFMEFVRRESPQDVLRLAKRLEEILTDENKSILIHVEGTRARTAGQKIEKISNVWADLAIKTGRPIIPLRFLGGLPAEDSGKKYNFPVGYVGQSYFFGKPIESEDLKKFPYADRMQFLRDAINNLGEVEDELPSPPDEPFKRGVQEYMEWTGVDEIRATIFQCLAASKDRPSFQFHTGIHRFDDLTHALVATGELAIKFQEPTILILPETPEGKWMGELAKWLYGPRGPQVSTVQNVPANVVIHVFGA